VDPEPVAMEESVNIESQVAEVAKATLGAGNTIGYAL